MPGNYLLVMFELLSCGGCFSYSRTVKICLKLRFRFRTRYFGTCKNKVHYAGIGHLKVQCHETFDYFFCLKDSTLAPNEQAKTVSRTFCVFAKINLTFSKPACQRSHWLCGHVIKYLLTTRTRCQRSQRLHGQDKNYADTFGKLWRLLTDIKRTIRW